jgi:hypothetical protein
MTDEDITKLANKLTVNLATKEDLKLLATNVDLKRLEVKIDELDAKTDVILSYASGIDEVSEEHGKRLKRIESLPTVAHELKLQKTE